MTERASIAWSQITAFASAADASLDKWLGDNFRLGLTEFRALTFLSQAPHKELRIAELARELGLSSTATTRLVSRLETKGFAQRDTCPDDGRGVYAVIDKPGEELLLEAKEPFEERVHVLLNDPEQFTPHLDVFSIATAFEEVSTLLKH